MKLPALYILTAVVGTTGATAFAGIVYSNGMSALDGGMNAGGAVVADDFILTDDSPITTVAIDVGYMNDSTPISQIFYSIYRDANGQPGLLQATGTTMQLRSVPLGGPENELYCTIEFELALPLNLVVGDRYWLGLRHSPAGGSRFLAYSSTSSGLEPRVRPTGTTEWSDPADIGDIAFRLMSPIPAPSVLGLGVVAAPLLMRRRR